MCCFNGSNWHVDPEQLSQAIQVCNQRTQPKQAKQAIEASKASNTSKANQASKQAKQAQQASKQHKQSKASKQAKQACNASKISIGTHRNPWETKATTGDHRSTTAAGGGISRQCTTTQ